MIWWDQTLEVLHKLWDKQESKSQVRSLVDAAHSLAQTGVGAALSLLPLLYLCLTATCCRCFWGVCLELQLQSIFRPCCCPAINQLEEGEVSYTMVATEERRWEASDREREALRLTLTSDATYIICSGLQWNWKGEKGQRSNRSLVVWTNIHQQLGN